MKYDFAYFHQNLLVNQNVRYEQYKNKTEFDIFLFQLQTESIYDLTEIDWSLFVEPILKMGIEKFCDIIGWREIQFKVLVYLQRNLASLCKDTRFASRVGELERECARLISAIINDRTPVFNYGDFSGMPPVDFYRYMQSPTLFTEKTPTQKWIDMCIEKRRVMRGGKPDPQPAVQPDNSHEEPAKKTAAEASDKQVVQTTIVNVLPGATYNDIHDNTNPTINTRS